MTREYWEANIPEFSDIVCDVFMAHDIDLVSLCDYKDVYVFIKDYIIVFCAGEDSDIWINFHYSKVDSNEFGNVFNFSNNNIYQAAVNSSHMIGIGKLNEFPTATYHCEYCANDILSLTSCEEQ